MRISKKGIAISTLIAIILFIVGMLILFAFITPIMQKVAPELLDRFTEEISKKVFCVVPGIKNLLELFGAIKC